MIKLKQKTDVTEKILHQKEITNLQEKMFERRNKLKELFINENDLELKKIKIDIELADKGNSEKSGLALSN